MTGHNYAVGGLTLLICSLQVYSMICRLHEAAEQKAIKKNDPTITARPHRCPRNFSKDKSSKMMEPLGTVQHCVDLLLMTV